MNGGDTMDLCRYVDVFHGTGESAPKKTDGIAARWFFIKARCGNTSPGATLPFGGISVSPYTGGYPTGYTDHEFNYHSKVKRCPRCKKLLGFTHLQQSGTGAIGVYYNYALTVPCYENSTERRDFTDEKARPGYYSCKTEDILCELTAGQKSVCHRYTFGKDEGTVKIDFTNMGLKTAESKAEKAEVLYIEPVNEGIISVGIKAEGIKLHFAVSFNGKPETGDTSVIIKEFGRQADLKIALSLRSREHALEILKETGDFDSVSKTAYKTWNRYLSAITIESEDDKFKQIFYSNLYHSLVKPCDRSDESFVFGDGSFMADFATLWDMYKTQIPLVMMLYRDEGLKIAETLLALCNKLGYIPNNLCFSDDYNNHSTQARCLGDYALLTAYRYGLIKDPDTVLKAAEKDIFSEGNRDFTEEEKCPSASMVLDLAELCVLCAELARENGNNGLAEKLTALSKTEKKYFDRETGLLTADSEYYEGTLYNYSFRQMTDMDERINLAGGKERFISLLDKFFGYGEPPVTQPEDPRDGDYIAKTMQKGIFEGFNNEPDTEAPFSYIYAGRHDRTCEIIRAGMRYMFTSGPGGLPGNNDSGALSSYYVFMSLGLFPLAGKDLFLIGSPLADTAKIKLSSGNTLVITAENNSPDNIYVSAVSFNGVPVENYMIKASELLKGGELKFKMRGKNDV